MKRKLLWASLFSSLLGLVVGAQLANAAPPNGKICGGDPVPADPTKRTNNATCAKACKYGCVYGDDKYKICEKKNAENCVDKNKVKALDFKKCTGDLWDSSDCKAPGSIVGTCQNNKPYCG